MRGEKTGKGIFRFDNSWYEGDFIEGDMDGEGKYYYGDTGRIYEGSFRQNAQFGDGTLTQPG